MNAAGRASSRPGLGHLVAIPLLLALFAWQLRRSGVRVQHEYEADAYAARHAAPADLIHALVKLYQDNAATLTPDPLYSAFYDSHPPALARIARLQGAGLRAQPQPA